MTRAFRFALQKYMEHLEVKKGKKQCWEKGNPYCSGHWQIVTKTETSLKNYHYVGSRVCWMHGIGRKRKWPRLCDWGKYIKKEKRLNKTGHSSFRKGVSWAGGEEQGVFLNISFYIFPLSGLKNGYGDQNLIDNIFWPNQDGENTNLGILQSISMPDRKMKMKKAKYSDKEKFCQHNVPHDNVSVSFKNKWWVSFLKFQYSRNEAVLLFLVLVEISLCGTLNCILIVVIAK